MHDLNCFISDTNYSIVAFTLEEKKDQLRADFQAGRRRSKAIHNLIVRIVRAINRIRHGNLVEAQERLR